jgi:hypothetical protein
VVAALGAVPGFTHCAFEPLAAAADELVAGGVPAVLVQGLGGGSFPGLDGLYALQAPLPKAVASSWRHPWPRDQGVWERQPGPEDTVAEDTAAVLYAVAGGGGPVFAVDSRAFDGCQGEGVVGEVRAGVAVHGLGPVCQPSMHAAERPALKRPRRSAWTFCRDALRHLERKRAEARRLLRLQPRPPRQRRGHGAAPPPSQQS